MYNAELIKQHEKKTHTVQPFSKKLQIQSIHYRGRSLQFICILKAGLLLPENKEHINDADDFEGASGN